MTNRSSYVHPVLLTLLVVHGCAGSHSSVVDPVGCGAELSADLATLDPGLRVVQTFCTALPEGPLGAFAVSDMEISLTQVRAEIRGRETVMTLERSSARIDSGSLTRATAPCITTFVSDDQPFETRLTRQVAVSSDGEYAAWGMTSIDRVGGLIGGAWYVSDARCGTEENAFHSVSAVAFAEPSRDAPHVLVSGNPEGSVSLGGVFLDGARLVAESTPGSLARLGDGILFGGVLGHGSAPATYFPMERAFERRELVVGTDGVVTGDPRTSAFVVVEGIGFIHMESRFDEEAGAIVRALEVRSVEVTETEVVFGEPRPLAGPAFSAAIPVVGSNRVLLRHSRGLVLVE